MPEIDIYRAYNFVLDIQGVQSGYFTEAYGLSVSMQYTEYRAGGDAQQVRKLPTRVKYGDLTLKWGLSESRELWEWLVATTQGEYERKDVSVVLLKPNGMDEATRWNLFNTYPAEWRIADLDAKSDQVAIETLTLAVERLERA